MSSTISAPSFDQIKTWFETKHVTITFTTEGGGIYTLVARPKVIILVRDNTGQAWSGTEIKVSDRHQIELVDIDETAWTTSRVLSFYVATN